MKVLHVGLPRVCCRRGCGPLPGSCRAGPLLLQPRGAEAVRLSDLHPQRSVEGIYGSVRIFCSITRLFFLATIASTARACLFEKEGGGKNSEQGRTSGTCRTVDLCIKRASGFVHAKRTVCRMFVLFAGGKHKKWCKRRKPKGGDYVNCDVCGKPREVGTVLRARVSR